MKEGRPPISDDEKKRRGTLDKRWSEEARAERKFSKIVSIHKDGAAQALPPPPDGLTPRAYNEYMLWGRTLLERGLLSAANASDLRLYAMACNNAELKTAAGKSVSGSDLATQRRFLDIIRAVDLPQQLAAPETKSIWSGIGFAGRVSAPSKQAGK